MSREAYPRIDGITRRQMLKGGAAAGLAAWLGGGGARMAGATALAPSDTSGEFKLISWEGEGEIDKWMLAIDRYMKENYPNMTVQAESGLAWDDYWTKLQTSIAGGAPPDLCWMHDSRIQSFAALDLIVPLDDYIAKSPPEGWPAKFYATQVKAFNYGGKQYAIPYDWAPGGFYVNLDLLDKAGVETPTEEWTFDDLLAAALKIKAAGDADTFGMNLPTSHGSSYWIVRCFGGETVTGDPPTAHFDDPNTLKAYQYLYDALWTHKVMPSQGTLKEMGLDSEFAFISGKVGISYALNDSASRMAEAVGDQFRWTVAPTPKGSGGRFQFVGGSGFSIPKGARFADIAYPLLRYTATDPSNLPTTAKMGSMFVSRADYWEGALPTKEEGIDPAAFKHAFYDLGKRDGVVPLYHPKYLEWDTSVYNKNMDHLWVGEESDVAKILGQVQADTTQLLSSLQ